MTAADVDGYVHPMNAKWENAAPDLSAGEGEPDGSLRTTLGLLRAVETNSGLSQRLLARELGIAVGLTNAYLKRCAKKGLIKMREVPARRYSYYLTPKGFAEKSRLSFEYLSHSFAFFRHAREDCAKVLDEAQSRGWKRIVLHGVSDLAEISAICALESGLTIVAVVDETSNRASVAGFPVAKSLVNIEASFDGVIVTDLKSAQESFAAAGEEIGFSRVLMPSLLGIGVVPQGTKL